MLFVGLVDRVFIHLHAQVTSRLQDEKHLLEYCLDLLCAHGWRRGNECTHGPRLMALQKLGKQAEHTLAA